MKPVLYEPTAIDFETSGGIATLSDCKSLIVTEEANGSYLVEATFPMTTKYAVYLEDVNYQIKCKPNDLDDYHVFYIYDHYKDMATGLLYIKAKSRTGKLGRRVVKKVVVKNKTGIEAMALLHDGMDLESDIQMFCDISSLGSTTFEVANPLECIKGMRGSLNQIYGGEIKHEPFRISLLRRRGKDNVTTIRYRKNLQGLKVELNWDGLITRIFPYADIQNSEGETERIYGEPVDSQYIGNYDGEVYARYIQFTEDQGVTDTSSLDKVAKNYFKSINKGVDKPKVSAEVDIRQLMNNKKFAKFRQLGLFDTFTLYHEKYNIDLELTVNKIVYDSLSENITTITAGDPKFTFFEQQESQFAEVMKKIPTKMYNSVFIDYVTKIISGNDGGNVIWWPKNRPTDLFFVDGETLEGSKQVLRINKSGIGFSSNGWKGPFDTAWTLDGTFVADFIRAGILSGILVQGVALKTLDDDDFQVVMEGGKVTFEKQVVSTGLDDVHGEELGRITATYGGGRVINGFAVVQDPGYIFSINSASKNNKKLSTPIFQVPEESTADNRLYNFYGKGTFGEGKITFKDNVVFEGNVEFKGRVDAKEMYIGGSKVIPGQNGGPGPGEGGTLSDVFVRVLALTAKYEMGDRSSGYYHPPLDDGAGWNYGKYSFTQVYEMDNFLAWLAKYYPDARSALVGSVGSTEFNNSWAAYGNANDKQFTRMQAEYFCRTKLKPAIEGLKASTGVDFNDGQKWLGTLGILASIQNWYPAAVSNGFFKTITQQFANRWDDAAFITTVCDYIVANASSMVAPAYVQGIRNRFKNEKNDALKLNTKTYIPFDGVTTNRGLKHLETLVGQSIGNGECYALSAEYSGYMGGCGLGAGTKYGMSHLTGVGSTAAASDIGIAYDWSAVAWKVIKNPTYAQLRAGAIINITRGALWANWPTVDKVYGHTGVIRGLENGRIQTYEQNTEQGRIIGKFDRAYTSPSGISSIVIPPN